MFGEYACCRGVVFGHAKPIVGSIDQQLFRAALDHVFTLH